MILSFGEKIRNLREEAGLTQSALGSKINMTQRRVSYIECGKFEPSLDDIKAFCRFFGVTADFLLGINEKNKGL